jgi:hypothetical protein
MAYPTTERFSTVTEALSQRTVDYLKKLLNLLPVDDKPTRKADLVKAIAAHLQGKNLHAVWKNLDSLQQTAVAEAVFSENGQFQSDQFQAKYGNQPNWGEGSKYGYGYIDKPSHLGLFFHSSDRYSSGPGITLPDDLKQELRQFVPQPAAFTLSTCKDTPTVWQIERKQFDFTTRTRQTISEQLPVTHCDTERAAQHDLLAVLRLINLGKVAVSDKTFLPSAATIKVISPLLQGGDYYSELTPCEKWHQNYPIGPIKALAWPLIVQAAGFASLSGKKLQLTPAGQKALGADPAKTLQTAWKKWLKTRLLDELRRIENIKGQTGKGKRGLTAASGRRAVIVKTLSECPEGRWVAFEDFRRYMIATDRTFEVSRAPEHLYFLEAGYGNLGNVGSSWSILQTCYLKCFLFEYAATLGLLDVAYISPYDAVVGGLGDFWGTDDLAFLSRYDGLVSFRVNALGAYCLGLSAGYTPMPVTVQSILRVLPNLDVIMTGQPLSSAEILVLELYAKKVSDAVWKLDRDQALSSVAAGHSLSDLRQLLEQTSQDALPNTVEQFLADLETRSQGLKDRGIARLIECTDPTLATLIANDSRTKKYCILAGDRHLVVPAEGETRFRNALRKLGYTIPLR